MRPRLRAALIHFGGSVAVALATAAQVFLVWYPHPFERLAGGSGLFALVVSVDVVMGPLITLVVFDLTKPRRELVRDLAIVLSLQLSALGYGLHTVYAARPVVVALEAARFRVVTAVDVMTEELPQAVPSLAALSWTGPVLVRTEAPTSGDEQFDAIQLALAGRDLGTRPKYWRPWDATGRSTALSGSKPLAALARARPTDAPLLEDEARRVGRPVERLRYLPVVSRFSDAVALIDDETGNVLGYALVSGF